MPDLQFRMTQRHWRVLDALAVRSPQHRAHLPNGNGHTFPTGATPQTMSDLLNAGLVAKVSFGFEMTAEGALKQRAGA